MTLSELAIVGAMARALRGLPPANLAEAGGRVGAYPVKLLEQLNCWEYSRYDRAALVSEVARRGVYSGREVR